MPWERMTEEQLQEFLDVKAKLEELPGVQYVQPEYRRGRQGQPGISVYVAPGFEETLRQLPAHVAKLPVTAVVEDPRTGNVLEVIDLRDDIHR